MALCSGVLMEEPNQMSPENSNLSPSERARDPLAALRQKFGVKDAFEPPEGVSLVKPTPEPKGGKIMEDLREIEKTNNPKRIEAIRKSVHEAILKNPNKPYDQIVPGHRTTHKILIEEETPQVVSNPEPTKTQPEIRPDVKRVGVLQRLSGFLGSILK